MSNTKEGGDGNLTTKQVISTYSVTKQYFSIKETCDQISFKIKDGATCTQASRWAFNHKIIFRIIEYNQITHLQVSIYSLRYLLNI